MTDELSPADLAAKLARFESASNTFPIRPDHLVPDLMLRGFSKDVVDHGHATLQLLSSTRPRAAFGPARAAKEAADEMVLLATSAAYDLEGARYLALYTFEAITLRSACDAVEELKGGTPEPLSGDPFHDHMSDMAEAWDALSAPKGQILRDVAAQLVGSGRRTFARWDTVNVPKELAIRFARLEERVGTGPDLSGIEEQVRVIYSAASMHAHPRPRINPKRISRTSDGQIEIEEFEDAWESLNGIPQHLLVAALAIAQIALGYSYQHQ